MDGKITTLKHLRNALLEAKELIAAVYAVKQDTLSGQPGQVVRFDENGEASAYDMAVLLKELWPEGPYQFSIDENGHLIAVPAGTEEYRNGN